PLQACAEGRIGVGNDLNPFAHLLTAAKVEPASRAETSTRVAALRLGWAASAPDWIALAEAATAPDGGGTLVPAAGSGAGGRPTAAGAAADDGRDRAPRRRARCRRSGPDGPARARPAGPGPLGGDLAALSPGRQVRLLQLAADVAPRLRLAGDRCDARRCPPP